MLQLQNTTPFKATIAVLPDRAGIDTLFVIVKATATLRPTLSLADEQTAPIMADEYHGDPARSSLRAVSDLHLGKPGTDVLLTGRAWAPEGRPAPRTLVTLSVAERRKSVHVSGDRIWRNGQPSNPQPFESIPLVWERAFGGWHRRGDAVQAEDRNPVGSGFAGGRSAGEMEGLPVPNLEDPAALLSQAGQTPAPACFAPVAPAWMPRRAFAGTYDAAWQQRRAPYLPDDFDPRFFQCAAPEFTFDRYLQGGEPVEVTGAHPEGPLAFNVPPTRVLVAVTIAGSVQHPPANLETLSIEPDDNRACLTWRASVPCDRQVLKVEQIVVSLAPRGAHA